MEIKIMKTKICTDIEQSKRLIELGIDVNTADIIYNIFDKSCIRHDTPIDNYHRPAWSLSALLDILSKQKFIIKCLERHNEYQYNINIPSRHCNIWFSSLLDAVFEMVVWLKENNKI